MSDLDHTYVRQALSYDPESGIFTWRTRPMTHFKTDATMRGWNTRYAGTIAGTVDGDGYVQIRLAGVKRKAHRLAWLLTFLTWPDGVIDHRNGNPSDNSIKNLRCVSRFENQHSRALNRNNSTGFIGAHRYGGRYSSKIRAYGVSYDLGSFATAEDAHRAYLIAKSKLHKSQPAPRQGYEAGTMNPRDR